MGKKEQPQDSESGLSGRIMFEATIHDIRHHNSKIDDNAWVDVTIRVAGEAGITAAMNLHKAQSKLVKVTYQIEE